MSISVYYSYKENFTSDATIADGECIIDVDFVGGAGDTDVASYSMIKMVAESLLFQCVFTPNKTPHGGSAAGFGISWSFVHTERR